MGKVTGKMIFFDTGLGVFVSCLGMGQYRLDN